MKTKPKITTVKRRPPMRILVPIIIGIFVISLLIVGITSVQARRNSDLSENSISDNAVSIKIVDFTAGLSVDESYNVPVSFEITADEAGEFAYMLYAVLNNQNEGMPDELLLARGYGMLDQILNLNVYIGHILGSEEIILRLVAISMEHSYESAQDTAWLEFIQ